jgi:TonB-dependent SusC/RagA subfamily outer membrane receptor
MKLTTLLLITAILQVSAGTYAQRVTLSEKNTPLILVFEKISEQTGFDFIASAQNLKKAKSVTIRVQNEELKSVLDKIFADQPLTFVIQEKMVVVSKKIAATNSKTLGTIGIPIDITGEVTDTAGVPLPNATIRIQPSGSVALTDSLGRFTVRAEAGDIIQVSFVGYQPYSFKVKADRLFEKIVLHAITAKLNNVTVISTGYQTLPKERATGSFASPQKEMYDARVSTGVLERLQGITSGLVFNAGPGGLDPTKPDISIRGRSTIYSNDQPLIVVDSFPFNGDLNDLNPQDVESIDILKDAAAAAIWGVKAGNGVIVITTKKGKLSQETNISITSNLTVGQKPDLYYDPNYLPSKEYIDIQQYLFRRGKYDADLVNVRTYPSIPAAVEIMAARRSGSISAQDSINRIAALTNVDARNGLLKYYYTNPVHQQYGVNLSLQVYIFRKCKAGRFQLFWRGYQSKNSAALVGWGKMGHRPGKVLQIKLASIAAIEGHLWL